MCKCAHGSCCAVCNIHCLYIRVLEGTLILNAQVTNSMLQDCALPCTAVQQSLIYNKREEPCTRFLYCCIYKIFSPSALPSGCVCPRCRQVIVISTTSRSARHLELMLHHTMVVFVVRIAREETLAQPKKQSTAVALYSTLFIDYCCTSRQQYSIAVSVCSSCHTIPDLMLIQQYNPYTKTKYDT